MKRSTGYRLLRAWGDVNAVRRGPKAVGRRAANRLVWRFWPFRPPRL